MTCDFKFCRFCGHGDECSANGHQRSQCKYKRLQEAKDAVDHIYQATDEPWTINVGDLEQGAPFRPRTINVGDLEQVATFRPQFMYARPDTTYGVTAGTAATTATHTARNLDLGF